MYVYICMYLVVQFQIICWQQVLRALFYYYFFDSTTTPVHNIGIMAFYSEVCAGQKLNVQEL